ncbi:MAG: mevalonate kinase [Cenarchaeum sp. SB0665_bin_23]|nr:mevalonate kinase [Cenarchaeum sp. SB0667_bin_13]MXY61271.1 mevalonate kinase [Cenarchaeum sp. SB0665_bin_23]MYB47569.1 mevalonate kinase [Cenarchaeum sp. SB0662_bin_33]MYC79031.1 mevalonate kinase [Cenarchaeum sp. SB0661_bin_35]MYG33532.1 mevalonate kinase [Cenarchaeum sp. SB0677_bin_16]MYI51231.1 mevalonate kinase [Cenarchaeum sp. SB0673_bin_9]
MMRQVCSAPGKIILFGEHFVVYNSRAILCAIDKRVEVTAQRRRNNTISIKSNMLSASIRPSTPHMVVDKRTRPFYYIAQSLGMADVEINIRSSLPSGAGLGSSSACCVATAGAVLPLSGMNRSILDVSIEAERTIQPSSSGADCAVCTHGGLIEYAIGTPPRQLDTPIPSDLKLIVANSGVNHNTGEMVARVRHVYKKYPKKFTILSKKADSLTSLAMDSINDIPKLGYLAASNQLLLEKIGISNNTLRQMIRIADRHSYGSKITGSGGGGCIVAITDDTNAHSTLMALSDAGYDSFVARITRTGAST